MSFPFLFHYRRLIHWRFHTPTQELIRLNPSFNSVSIYLPAKRAGGTHFCEDALSRFLKHFSPFGRVILAEDLGEDWEQHALLAARRMPVQPVLTTSSIDRWNQEDT